LINTRSLSIVINKPIPLSIGCPIRQVPKITRSFRAAQKWWKTVTCRRGELASTSTSVPTHASTARRIYAFFAKHVDDSINVHGEAQRGDAGLAILILVGEL
jgi:hypothetical protein